MTETLFGTDGIRGRANIYPMTVDLALSLGKAIACILRRRSSRPRVVIGKDTRLSGYMFENALIAGLTSMGVDTLMVGPLPTPGVAFITRAYRASAGIVISASHNPYYDNGIKIFDSEGFKIADELEEELDALVRAGNFTPFLPKESDVGRNKRIADADGRYIEHVKATFPKGKTLKGMKIFLDCANGAAHRVAPLVFSELDAEVSLIGNTPNGLNINDHCGSLHPSQIQKGVVAKSADVGIALDGDGDRVLLVDEKGAVVDGDTLLAIAASDLKDQGLLIGNRVVATVMTNLGIVDFLTKQGIEVIFSKVGDRHVIQKMLQSGALVGGEQSGHLIFLEHNTTGDGLVSALQILKVMRERATPLSKLSSMVERMPQMLLNVPISKKPPLETLEKVQKLISRTSRALGERGRVLVRYSGTENLCRVMVEGAILESIEAMAQEIADAIALELGVN